jgi:starch phosphorylase
MKPNPKIAYFSMEIALEPTVPTYSGGLGVLAGDTIRSCADLGVRMVAVTLLHRKGYFKQVLDAQGNQSEGPAEWRIEDFLEPLGPPEPEVQVVIEGRVVHVRAWRYRVRGVAGTEVETLLLDTALPSNDEAHRHLTDTLYGGDDRYRLSQEIVLGIGGVRMLRALGHRDITRFHLNEGHAALAVLSLLQERFERPPGNPEMLQACIEEIRRQCVFTTHTPIPAGHDRFPRALAASLLTERHMRWLDALEQKEVLNMTDVALRGSHFVNGVAMRHGEVSRGMFPEYPIRSISNGIHPLTWASPPFRQLFDKHIPDWRTDALSLRYAVSIPRQEIWEAHEQAKRNLLAYVGRHADSPFNPEALTIGFARRATAYKRATLVLSDLDRLAKIAAEIGPIQLLFAGKAHPRDGDGKAVIRRVFEARDALRGKVSIAYLPDYDMESALLLCSGCDIWLNTPIPPREASGTSGMKAALNGVPSVSILDGWWLEGHVEGVTGWAIGEPSTDPNMSPESRNQSDQEALYDTLATRVMPCFYTERGRFLEMMRFAIALNASFYNTQRMALQYLYEGYTASPPNGAS